MDGFPLHLLSIEHAPQMPVDTYVDTALPSIKIRTNTNKRHRPHTKEMLTESYCLESLIEVFQLSEVQQCTSADPGNGLENKFSFGEWLLDVELSPSVWMGWMQLTIVHMIFSQKRKWPTTSRPTHSRSSECIARIIVHSRLGSDAVEIPPCRGPCGLQIHHVHVRLSGSGRCCRCSWRFIATVGTISGKPRVLENMCRRFSEKGN